MNDIEDDPLYLSPGTQVGAYLVRGYLGKGTGSLVFEVESGLGNRYALKLSRYTAGPPNSLSWEMDERFTRNIICVFAPETGCWGSVTSSTAMFSASFVE